MKKREPDSYPVYSRELSTEERIKRDSDETPLDVMRRLYRMKGEEMKMSEHECSDLTPIATNRLTVYDAVERILRDMDKIPEKTARLRFEDNLPWDDICKIVCRSNRSVQYYWRHFIDSTMDIVFDSRLHIGKLDKAK